MRVCVIGIGSPWGDDAAGLEVARRLRERAGELPPGARIETVEAPGPDLADALEGSDLAVVVDGVRSAAAPGTVERIDPERIARDRTLSTHGFGPLEAVELARALGRGPARVEWVGITIGGPRGVPGGGHAASAPGRSGRDPTLVGVGSAAFVGAAAAEASLSPAVERGVEQACQLVAAICREAAAPAQPSAAEDRPGSP